MHIEDILRNIASQIANNYTDPGVKASYLQAAERLRYPYWDWAASDVPTKGLPSIFTNLTLSVNTPPFNLPTNVANPLRAYSFVDTVGTPFGAGDIYNPQNGATYQVPVGYIYSAPGYSTVRQPVNGYATNDDAVQSSVKLAAAASFIPALFQMFQTTEFEPFSNHYATVPNRGSQNATHFLQYASLEGVHDSVHRAVGGLGGHFRFNTMAGFDPVFFLHHCNVDRVFALWQALYPDQWIEPSLSPQGTFTIPMNTTVDVNTELTPFYRRAGDRYYNSNDMRDVLALGYTYPELAKFQNLTMDKRRKVVFDMYRPNRNTTYEVRWYIGLDKVVATGVPGAFSVHVFLNPQTPVGVDTPLTDPTYCGSADFSSGMSSSIKTYEGVVELTDCMVRLKRTINSIPGNPVGDPETALSSLAGWPVLYSDLAYVTEGYNGQDFSQYVKLDNVTIFYTYEKGNNGKFIRGAEPKTPNIVGKK
mgnify:CR=1 FL=1